MSPPARPQITRKPTAIKVYRATWAYEAQGDDELFFEGDLIFVSDQSQEWWRATCKGKPGLVPGNYLASEEAGNSNQIDFPLQEAAKRGNLDWVRNS